MTKTRILACAQRAALATLGLLGQAAAQDSAPGHARNFQIVPHANVPDASTALNQGVVGIAYLPPAAGDWPCFGGSTDCSSVAQGGMVIGTPIQNWSLSDCNVKGTTCGQIFWTFEDDSASGDLVVSFTVKQGKTTIQSEKPQNYGSITGSPGSIWVIDFPFGGLKGAAAGPATLTVSTTVGTTKITGKATINLE